MNFIKNALDFLFPPACGVCEKIGEGYLCKNCYQELQKYKIKTNIRTERFHLLRYEGIIREKMIAYKFYDKSYLYNLFYKILIDDKSACEFLKSYDIIIPVPIHKKRKWQRGYNQSELIAKKISSELKIPIVTDVLKKQINTLPQSTLDKIDRAKNAQNVYNVENRLKILNKRVLIFDDIYTTGATAQECKKVLKIAGANKVGVMTIAKD